jgi:hypothetical protein
LIYQMVDFNTGAAGSLRDGLNGKIGRTSFSIAAAGWWP